MRIAFLMNLALRKLGSLEGWLVAISQAARLRGHAVDVYARMPLHPEVARSLLERGCNFDGLESLENSRIGGVRKLSSYDVIHINMFQPRSTMALMAYAAWPARVMITDHSSGPVPSEATRRSAIAKLADRLTCARLDGLVGVSNYVRDRNAFRYGLDGRKARTVYNGVDVERFRPQRAADSPPDRVSMLSVAYLIRQKGHDVLLRAVAEMKVQTARLTIAGDGPEEANLRALAAQLGIRERVEFAGLRDDVPALLERADIFVHPAIWAEAFGLTIAEAMAHARPVVASKIGGIPEIVIEGIHGRLVEPGNALALAKALDSLALDPERRTKMGAAARDRVLERFTLDACVDGHLSWMEEITGGQRKPLPSRARGLPGTDLAGAGRSPTRDRTGR